MAVHLVCPIRGRASRVRVTLPRRCDPLVPEGVQDVGEDARLPVGGVHQIPNQRAVLTPVFGGFVSVIIKPVN